MIKKVEFPTFVCCVDPVFNFVNRCILTLIRSIMLINIKRGVMITFWKKCVNTKKIKIRATDIKMFYE